MSKLTEPLCLQASHLEKKYGQRKVVDRISININQGEIVGLLGPNGAGKTTLFYMIVGLIPVDNGEIHLGSKNLTNLAIHARAQLGISYLPQDSSIFRKLSVADNIMAILELRSELNQAQRQEKLDKLLQEFRIEHIRDTLGINLSGGERRRVEIARMLATDPKFILLDEPFAGIDPISVIDVKKIIKQLCKMNIGMLITDHNVRDTLTICNRAYIVNQGKIICEGDTKTILMNDEVRAVYLGNEFDL